MKNAFKDPFQTIQNSLLARTFIVSSNSVFFQTLLFVTLIPVPLKTPFKFKLRYFPNHSKFHSRPVSYLFFAYLNCIPNSSLLIPRFIWHFFEIFPSSVPNVYDYSFIGNGHFFIRYVGEKCTLGSATLNKKKIVFNGLP